MPITVLLYAPPVSTNCTLLMVKPDCALAVASSVALVPLTAPPFEGTSTAVVGGGLTVKVKDCVAVFELASVALMVIG